MTTSHPGCLNSFFRLFGFARPEPEPELPYHLRDDFLSNAEKSFFHVAKTVLGEYFVICPKVNLHDLFFVTNRRENQGAVNRINRKHIDFLVCKPKSMEPVFAIELDDSSHRRKSRRERDAFVDAVFETAGLPLLRIPAQRTYDTQALAEQFKSVLQPDSQANPTPKESPTEGRTCPKCGSPMQLRTAKRGKHAGQQFYGCSNYPQCKTTVPVD
jgi:very-short-patch-repair endonuclease